MNGIIIGGGIGGLATAIALSQRGISCAVYEQAPEIHEVGAGLVMSPNAMQILNWLGLSDELQRISWSLNAAKITNAVGKPAQVVDVKALTKKYGFGMQVVHRGRLQQLLANQLATSQIQTGKKLVSIAQTTDYVQVAFADGTTADTDFVIGADGIRSATRRLLFGEKPLRYSGQTCWRAIVDYTQPIDWQRTSLEYWGLEPGLRVGLVPCAADQLYIYVTAIAVAGQRDRPGEALQMLKHLSEQFTPDVQAVINAVDESCIHHSDLYDLVTIPTWVDKRVALLGDAAHATTPNLGQGACQAIEDAYALAGCLSQGLSIPAALQQYQQLRKPKADQVVKISRQIGQAVNVPKWLKPLVLWFMSIVPASVSERQFDQIFSVDYLHRFRALSPSITI